MASLQASGLLRVRHDLDLRPPVVVPPVALDDGQPVGAAQLEHSRPAEPEDPGRLTFGHPVRLATLVPLEGEVLDVGAVESAVLVVHRLREDAVRDHLRDGQRGDAEDLAGLDPGQPRMGRVSESSLLSMTGDSTPRWCTRPSTWRWPDRLAAEPWG